MTAAVNWQLQINIEFYVQNIDLKDNSSDVFIQYLLFWNMSSFNKNFNKFGTFCILSQHVSKNYKVFIIKPNVALEYLSFQICIQEVLFSALTEEAIHVDWYLQALSCKLHYFCSVSYDKLWIFVVWNIRSILCSASWNFMHVSTKPGNSRYPVIENITLQR
jgi:hypothetical protein